MTTYSISPPLKSPTTFIGSDMKGKLNPSTEVALHFNCLALQLTLAVPEHEVHDPRQSGFKNVAVHPLLRNLWAGLI
jgi:hypothetical protein